MNVLVTRRRVAATAVLVAAVSGSGAACTNNDPDSPQSGSVPPSSSPTPSVDPSVADAEQQARAAYAGYIDAWARASQAADPDNPDLPRYVADPLLSLTRHNIRVLNNKGAVQVGAQKATVRAVKVDLSGTPQTVTIDACLDYSDLKLVYRSNQSPVPNSAITDPTLPAVATVARFPTGQWLVTESKEGGASC